LDAPLAQLNKSGRERNIGSSYQKIGIRVTTCRPLPGAQKLISKPDQAYYKSNDEFPAKHFSLLPNCTLFYSYL
jgi:hypothetical protein